ncbi:uncharacterized protein DS421_16g543050 [Arachis hypogaea]|nr:uncharacterized protein DS421_16g543050 [Arachis hypogaea]
MLIISSTPFPLFWNILMFLSSHMFQVIAQKHIIHFLHSAFFCDISVQLKKCSFNVPG